MGASINIIHHHLHPGGVTRVIQLQVKALQQLPGKWNPKIITGHVPDGAGFNVDLRSDARLNYLNRDNLKSMDLSIAKCNLKVFIKKMISKNGIVHFHNLNLGKNPLLTVIMYELAEAGFSIVNHAHDFAEDRPDNYAFLKHVIEDSFRYKLHEVLYPSASNYQFAVLNSFDYERINQYGVEQSRITLLPNPVHFESVYSLDDKKNNKDIITQQLDIDTDKKLITYPVRAIRRKNIGEFILLAFLFHDQANWLITQAPMNPEQIPIYEDWKSFCSENNIPVLFEAGKQVEFEQLINASDFCITTSAREGFGMSYLEPWLMNTPVVGRDLSNVLGDIKRNGLKFSYLYEKISINRNGTYVDFKDMSEELQKEVIQKAQHDKDYLQEIWKNNPFLNRLLAPVPVKLIESNIGVIKQNYSIKKYGEQLDGIYKRILEQT